MRINESKGLHATGLNRREFFKVGLAALGSGIVVNTAKAEGDGKVRLAPPSRADRLRKEIDDREQAMRQWGSFSENDIQRMREAYAEEIARGRPITKEAVLGIGALGVLGILIATGVIAALGDEDESLSNQNQGSKK